jgi:hypothetical protein
MCSGKQMAIKIGENGERGGENKHQASNGGAAL